VNLADLADKVTTNVKAKKADRLDKIKLQNGVLEPLREADLMYPAGQPRSIRGPVVKSGG
jgi:pyruvate-formate lyase-activating enzyme